jgi:hypothetical protein
VLLLRFKKTFKVKPKKIPIKLSIKGIFFMYKGINSKSSPTLFVSCLYTEFPQKVLPIPTKASFKKKPDNKLPTDKTAKAKPIDLGNS